MITAILFDFFDVFRIDVYKAWLAANNLRREGDYAEVSRQLDMGEITTEQFRQRLSDLIGHTVTFEEIDGAASLNDEVVKIAYSFSQLPAESQDYYKQAMQARLTLE